MKRSRDPGGDPPADRTGETVIHSLVYCSAADPALTGTDLRRLLGQCRADNAAADVTGLLLLRSGFFLQFLEGAEPAIESLFARIAVDERHDDVVVVRRRGQQRRNFPDWTMAYGEVDPLGTGVVAVEMPPPEGPAAQTDTEAAFVRELLELFDA